MTDIKSATEETIEAVIKKVFPIGTFPDQSENQNYKELGFPGNPDMWDLAPFFPTDLFAVCAYFFQISPVYRWFIIEDQHNEKNDKCVSLKKKNLKNCIRLGAQWKNKPLRPEIQERWSKLYRECGKEKIVTDELEYGNFNNSNWCMEAYELLIIADEACKDLAFLDYSSIRKETAWFEKFTRMIYFQRLERQHKKYGKVDQTSAPSTMAARADRNVVSVQNKSRISNVGCTLRNLSKYLSLVPRPSIVRTSWQPSLSDGRVDEDGDLNLLLIPFPYNFSEDSFLEVNIKGSDKAEHEPKSSWGWFDIKKDWLNSESDIWKSKFAEFIVKLIKKAEAKSTKIHGIVLPELSLNWDTYSYLIEEINNNPSCSTIEFLIAGSDSNCNELAGNFALSTEFFQRKGGKREAVSMSRSKHHRWKLDESQIDEYNIGSNLSPDKNWWERINLYPREIKLSVFRQNSVFAILICEDLARSDPCHEVLKSMGPNLVFGLLLDGPQIQQRWSSSYAKMLSSDPGCSVLTFTSQALLKKCHERGKYTPSWEVGLWTDQFKSQEPLICEEGNHAILLSLSSLNVEDQTLCGRTTNDAKSWKFKKQKQISLPIKDIVKIQK